MMLFRVEWSDLAPEGSDMKSHEGMRVQVGIGASPLNPWQATAGKPSERCLSTLGHPRTGYPSCLPTSDLPLPAPPRSHPKVTEADPGIGSRTREQRGRDAAQVEQGYLHLLVP